MFDWIQNIADWLIYGVFGIAQQTKLGHALNFFVYDTLKILFLLFLITFIMGIVNSYFPIDRIRNFYLAIICMVVNICWLPLLGQLRRFALARPCHCLLVL